MTSEWQRVSRDFMDTTEKYVGWNPAANRNEKNAHCADPCTEGAPIVRQDLSGRTAM